MTYAQYIEAMVAARAMAAQHSNPEFLRIADAWWTLAQLALLDEQLCEDLAEAALHPTRPPRGGPSYTDLIRLVLRSV